MALLWAERRPRKKPKRMLYKKNFRAELEKKGQGVVRSQVMPSGAGAFEEPVCFIFLYSLV